jgi:hypothetical protein
MKLGLLFSRMPLVEMVSDAVGRKALDNLARRRCLEEMIKRQGGMPEIVLSWREINKGPWLLGYLEVPVVVIFPVWHELSTIRIFFKSSLFGVIKLLVIARSCFVHVIYSIYGILLRRRLLP